MPRLRVSAAVVEQQSLSPTVTGGVTERQSKTTAFLISYWLPGIAKRFWHLVASSALQPEQSEVLVQAGGNQNTGHCTDRWL